MRTPLQGWRDSVRRVRGGSVLLKSAVFAVGLFFVLLGLALVVLPGPLTIPPILIGLYIWSTEFGWAERLREKATENAREAWEGAKKRPVWSATVTALGLLGAAAAVIAAQRYDVVDRVLALFR